MLLGGLNDLVQNGDICCALSVAATLFSFQGHTLISEWGRVLGAIVFRQWRLWRHRQYRRLPRVDSEGMKVVEQSVV